MAIEFGERIRRIPLLPPGGRLRPRRRRRDARLQRVVFAPAAGSGRGRGAAPWPGPTGIRIRPIRRCARRCRTRYGVATGRIALGNGSCDILLSAGEALLEPGAEVVYAWPAFSVYPHLAAASGARAIEVPLDAEDRHDLDAMAAEITVATRLVLDLQPQQPHLDRAPASKTIEAFLERVPRHVCVILDEAYCEFALALGDTYASIELLRRWPNLVAAADVLQGLRPGRSARRLRAVRLRGLPGRGRPGPAAVLPQHGAPRRPPSRPCATRTRSSAG